MAIHSKSRSAPCWPRRAASVARVMPIGYAAGRRLATTHTGPSSRVLSHPRANAHPWAADNRKREKFMELRKGISLSKKHQKNFQVFPYFFRHALNYFYFLTDECGFLKPKLDTWKNEGMVEFVSTDIRILVQYESPGWVTVCFQKIGIPGQVYEHGLFNLLDIPFDVSLRRPSQKKYSQEAEKQMQEIESDIERTTKYLSLIISDNREKIFSYLRNARSLV